MPKRFYLMNSGAAPVSPPFDAGWEQVGEADRVLCVPVDLSRKNQALTGSVVTVPITTTQDILVRQFVTDVLPPHYQIDGYVGLVLLCGEEAATINATLAVVIKVVSQDGATVRGTLFSVFGTGSEFAVQSSPQTRILDYTTTLLTPLITQIGDRLVIELGVHVAAPTTAGSVTMRMGNSAGSNFAITSGLSTDLNPSILFSSDINNSRTVRVRGGMSASPML